MTILSIYSSLQIQQILSVIKDYIDIPYIIQIIIPKEEFMSFKTKISYVASFVEKLWEILHNQDLMHILMWTPQGVSFIIKDKQQFSRQILPRYFKHSNFASFVRQLNMYNFHKVRGSKHENEFSHNLFIKQKKQLLIGIRRKPSEIETEFGKQLIDNHDQENKNTQYSTQCLHVKDHNIFKVLDDTIKHKKIDYIKENEQLKLENAFLEQQCNKQTVTNKKNMEKIGRFFTTVMSIHLKQSMFSNSNCFSFDFHGFSKFFNHLRSNEDPHSCLEYQKMMVATIQDQKIEEKTEKTSQLTQKSQSFVQDSRILSIQTHKTLPNLILKQPILLDE